MARDISTISQTNLWGKQSDTGMGLEPQRNDLYLVDFKTARQNVAKAANVSLAEILPQYVRSVTLPEIRTKADPVRRDSIPFQMPSWDDPLDAVKLVFLLDTHDQDDTSNVIQFLDAWLALTRAGRGSRFQGYNVNPGWMTLNANFTVDFMFSVYIYLLRGAQLTSGGFVDTSGGQQFQQFMVNANAAYRNAQKRQGLVQTGQAIPASLDTSSETAINYALQDTGAAFEQDMVMHSTYTLFNAWLGAYKISDLNATESGLVTVEATFYIDDISLDTIPPFEGEAKVTDPSSPS